MCVEAPNQCSAEGNCFLVRRVYRADRAHELSESGPRAVSGTSFRIPRAASFNLSRVPGRRPCDGIFQGNERKNASLIPRLAIWNQTDFKYSQ